MKERKKNEQKERKPNWKEYTATVEEIQDFLMDHVPLRHNVITGRVEYRDGDMWQPITDLGFRRMRSHGERGYVVVAYSAEEIRARKRIKAHDAQPESAPNDDTFDTNDTIF